ncbi:gliding motility-associated C-terminal domain-containing protein [Winogradskyella echinorum]|uniref:Gliding motility-associated C-terminal domain-containing protein n=1 Tax=Winogradskyella echinorum TaxID=538189 RepID=A0ABR6Y0U4_9FLAO|nr:gliding motility-associated C-terminal domain-containing protein [Winogradskyella echinorum]MBC3846372.1 gliding motility-associated C-terminal domain-containing protein [Winogradskyella echinorum]MBC5750720.1 gliding motility-associated C-terminal domain-containing protein [Winogradskyella echinorum]
MLKPTIANKILFGLCFLALFVQEQLSAQIVIGTPNLGFTQACASESFNTYSTTFIFSPESSVNASNQFTVEMSDADGDFSNPTIVFTSASGSITTSPATVDFSIPLDTAGENYRIRIKSSSPAATSSQSIAFPAYYKSQDSPFSINNLVSTGAYCTGGSYLLTIDNPGTGSNDSPLLYPNLTFKWYRETSPTTSVFVADGPTLSVSEEGTYFVETNYGTCTSNSFSNRVTISEAVSGEANATIASSLGNPYCPEQGLTTLTTIGGITYQWYKDGVIIPDATDQMYQTNESGTFSVQVDLGDCSAAGSIDLVSELFDSSIDVPEVNYIFEDESLMVTVTTTASNPEFEWYLDNTLIVGASDDFFEATEFGNYKVIISETTGCEASKTYEFIVEEAQVVEKIPNVISPNGDGINDTWEIPMQYVSGTNTEVKILNDRGKVIFQTMDYQNNWPQNQLELTSVNSLYYYIITTTDLKTRQGSITIVK